MRIALGVHGRFHAFDLANALAERGHDVTVLTNYPRRVVARWAPSVHVETFLTHGILSRFLRRASRRRLESQLHSLFGRWLKEHFSRHEYDVTHTWSGVAEEAYSHPTPFTLRGLVRGSSHIRIQKQLLNEEIERTGIAIEVPSEWMVDREEREYDLADYVAVPSTFARDTFVDRAVPPSQIFMLPLGADTAVFRPADQVVRERTQRIMAGAPIRVLFVGSVSLRKGFFDFKAVAESLAGNGFVFKCVGPQEPSARRLISSARDYVEFVPKRAQKELPKEYAWGDVFLFPTIEDGFAVVLTQAQAAGLPVLTTTNCAGPDILEQGKTGWVVPIRRPDIIQERLTFILDRREKLAEMAEVAYRKPNLRTWSEVARDFEAFCESARRESHQRTT